MSYMMVAFANGKGGVGKTALACSYAASCARDGADVQVMDLDQPQQTAVAWSRVRQHNELLPTIKVEAGNTRQALEMIGRCELLVVDTPGRTDKATLTLAQRATLTVIPTGANATYELSPTIELFKGLREEGIEHWRLGVVLSRLSPGEAGREEEAFARDYLAIAKISPLEGAVLNHPEYASALAQGYGLTETPGGKQHEAAQQMMSTISKAAAAAERRLQKLRGPEKDPERNRGRGGRE